MGQISLNPIFQSSLTLVWLSLITLSSKAEWKNPSLRYVDAYKEYLDATCPVPGDQIKHFVYFARDREALLGHPFLRHPRFQGAQIMYPWRENRGMVDLCVCLSMKNHWSPVLLATGLLCILGSVALGMLFAGIPGPDDTT